MIAPILTFALWAAAAPQPAWQTRLADLQDEIAAAHAAQAAAPERLDDKEWVKKRLHDMVALDQKARYFWINCEKDAAASGEAGAFEKTMDATIAGVDRYDTAQLKTLLAAYDWFTIDDFGAQADEDGWLLVQHADLDPSFQKEVLARLTRLYPSGRTSKHNYAFLYDRVAALSDKRPQRYGTQGDCRDGVWTPFPSEDPDGLDDRRAAMGLESIAERQAKLSARYCR